MNYVKRLDDAVLQAVLEVLHMLRSNFYRITDSR